MICTKRNIAAKLDQNLPIKNKVETGWKISWKGIYNNEIYINKTRFTMGSMAEGTKSVKQNNSFYDTLQMLSFCVFEFKHKVLFDTCPSTPG